MQRPEVVVGRTARVSASGEPVALDEQDRGAWDTTLIAERHRLVRERLAAGVAPGRYQILAAINAVHTSAGDVRDTDWSQVIALYDQLVRLDSSPIVTLNRAIAVAENKRVRSAVPSRIGSSVRARTLYALPWCSWVPAPGRPGRLWQRGSVRAGSSILGLAPPSSPVPEPSSVAT
jgi:hypothetical protein